MKMRGLLIASIAALLPLAAVADTSVTGDRLDRLRRAIAATYSAPQPIYRGVTSPAGTATGKGRVSIASSPCTATGQGDRPGSACGVGFATAKGVYAGNRQRAGIYDVLTPFPYGTGRGVAYGMELPRVVGWFKANGAVPQKADGGGQRGR